MKSLLTKIQKSYLLILAGVLIVANVLSFAPQAFALTYLVKPEIILTNMAATGNSALIVTFTTSASNTGTSLSVVFPAGFTVATTQTYSTSYSGVNCTALTGATSDLPGTPTASGSSQTITFSGLTAYSVSHSYCGVLTGTSVTNPSANTYQASLAAGLDSASNIGLDVISSDQVVVTATVPASFTLALTGGGSDPFTANLAVGSIGTTTGVTATMTTNGTGWVLYGFDSNSGLTSANNGHTIASTTPGTLATLTAGSEGYLTGVNSAGNTIVAAYNNASTSGKGSGLSTVVRQLVSGTGPISSTTASVTEFATISGTTPAASDYTDTITLLGAGTF